MVFGAGQGLASSTQVSATHLHASTQMPAPVLDLIHFAHLLLSLLLYYDGAPWLQLSLQEFWFPSLPFITHDKLHSKNINSQL